MKYTDARQLYFIEGLTLLTGLIGLGFFKLYLLLGQYWEWTCFCKHDVYIQHIFKCQICFLEYERSHFDDSTQRQSLQGFLWSLLRLTSLIGFAVWIRYVLIDGLTCLVSGIDYVSLHLSPRDFFAWNAVDSNFSSGLSSFLLSVFIEG